MSKEHGVDIFEVCNGRFNGMDKRLDRIERQSNDMHAIITNGLVDRVRTAKRLSMWSVGLIIIVLAGQIAMIQILAQYVLP